MDQFAGSALRAGIQIVQADNLAPILAFENHLGCRLPPSFRALVTRYRFKPFGAADIILSQTETGEPADEWGKPIKDMDIAGFMLKHGLIQFTNPADGGFFDPICFDTRAAKAEFPMVRLDHELILCYSKIGRKKVLYPSFLDFAQNLISNPQFCDLSDNLNCG